MTEGEFTFGRRFLSRRDRDATNHAATTRGGLRSPGPVFRKDPRARRLDTPVMAVLQLNCPETGKPVDVVSGAVPKGRVPLALFAREIPCPHCGENHIWTHGHLALAIQTLHDSPDATRVLVDHARDSLSAAALP